METLNLDMLPEEAKKQVIEYYNYLLAKTNEKLEKGNKSKPDVLSKTIDDLSWDMGEKLYNKREDLYER